MQWIVVQVKSQHEEVAIRNLEESGFKCFGPKLTLRKGDKSETVPMFRGYIFVEIEPEDMPFWRTIASHRGVLKILMLASGRPGYLPAGFVQALMDQGNRVEDLNVLMEYTKGQKITFTAGPLSGIDGIVHTTNRERVSLLVDLLGQDTIVQSTVHMIAPAERLSD